ncbi:hypothetical protein O0L34_g17823 [Tuta absoluta]|nr:hypothetical protein O0L34_g17823 [Tuta absoluta]
MSFEDSTSHAHTSKTDPIHHSGITVPAGSQPSISMQQFSDLMDNKFAAMKMELKTSIEESIKRGLNTVYQNFKAELIRVSDNVNARQNILENKLEDAKARIVQLENDNLRLETQLNSNAQSHLRNELEVSGIAETTTENLNHVIRVVAAKVGVSLEDQDVDFITRAGPRRSNNTDGNRIDNTNGSATTRSIVVRFLRRSKRDEFIKAAKSRKNLTSADFEITGPPMKVYFNERLTLSNRQLFRATRTQAQMHNLRCWTRNGTIYVRERNGTRPPIQIKTIDDYSDTFQVSYVPPTPNTAK